MEDDVSSSSSSSFSAFPKTLVVDSMKNKKQQQHGREIVGGDMEKAAVEEKEEEKEGGLGEEGEEDEGEDEREDDDSEVYEYVYDDGDDGGCGEEDEEMGGIGRAEGARAYQQHVVFSGLDTIGCTNDMLLKKELMRLKADVEKGKRGWRVDLSWTESARMLGVILEHEGFVKANLELIFPKKYPQEPPKLKYLGPRYDDTVDFILGADSAFEPCKKENWNDTFTCTSLLMIIMELVKVRPLSPLFLPPSLPPFKRTPAHCPLSLPPSLPYE